MSSETKSATTTLLEPEAKPPKSKSAQYYSIHPHWQDVSPIPQADQTGALAAIAYSPRYSEAMSCLRALMADNEVSERALSLTDDLINMNPAHYTVWIYRMRVLRDLWNKARSADQPTSEQTGDATGTTTPKTSASNEINPSLWQNIQEELKWLDEVSFRNLKNYQIWHHRQSLADLLPTDPDAANLDTSVANTDKPAPEPPLRGAVHDQLSRFISSEQRFLAEILSLDTKNYHVWSYRQWLCARFPSFLLPTAPHCPAYDRLAPMTVSIAQHYRSHPEIQAIDVMIADDLRNNSAWSHRYYLLFGHHELNYAQHHDPPLILKQVNEQNLLHKAGLVDMGLVEAEVEYTKTEIRKAPQNGSSWNYLRGVLRHGDIDIGTLRTFCEEFLGPEGDLWTDQWTEVEIEDAETGEKKTEKQELGVRSSHAVEWLSEIHGKDGTREGRQRSKDCFKALAEKWDPIRKGYWHYKEEQLTQDLELPETSST